MGVTYQKGTGVAKNEVEAVKWLEWAAANMRADASAVLGDIYRDGLGPVASDAI